MSIELQELAKMRAMVDGAYQVTITRISKTLESGQVEVQTLEGFAGFMATGGITRVTLGYVKPMNGSEFNFDVAIIDGGLHDVQLFDGAETYVGRGKFMKSERSQGAGEIGEASVDFTGEAKPFKKQ